MAMGTGRRLLLAAALGACLSAAAAAPTDSTNILFISSREAVSSDTAHMIESFRESLDASGLRMELFFQSLDSIRFGFSSVTRDLFVRSFHARFQDVRIDLIVAQASQAVETAVAYRNLYAPGTPVFCFDTIDNTLQARCAAMPAIWGRPAGDPMPSTLRLALRLFPKAKTAFFLAAMDPDYVEGFMNGLYALRDEFPALNMRPIINTDFPEAAAALAEADKDSVVILLRSNWRMPNGDMLSGLPLAERLQDVTTLPCFGISEESFGNGFVGGNLLDSRKMGQESAEVIEAILRKEQKPLPWLVTRASMPVLDYRALRRFKVPASLVPPGTSLRYQPPSFWIRYETQLKLTGLALLLLLAVLAAFAIRRRLERRILLESNARLEKTVEERTLELRSANVELGAANANLVASLRRIEGMQQRLVADTRDVVLGRIALGMAHEINNPLAALRSAVYSIGSVAASPGFEDIIRAGPEKLGLLLRLLGEGSHAKEGARSPEARRLLERELEKAGQPSPSDLADLLADSGLAGLRGDDLLAICDPANRDLLDFLLRIRILHDSAGVARDSTERIAETVETVRSYARDSVPARKGEPSSIEESLEQALFLFRKDLRRDIILTKSVEENVGAVGVAHADLVRAWTNLVQNAIEAMDEGGRLDIVAKRSGPDVIVEFRDSGRGVAPEVRDVLFTPFATTKSLDAGMGLGLSICRRIAENADGDITWREEDGKTVFAVRLPRVEAT